MKQNLIIIIILLQIINNEKHLFNNGLHASNNIDTIRLCHSEILKSYSFRGIDNAIKSEFSNQICPKIEYSCCTKYDIELALKNWDSNIRYRIENHYQNYLWITKDLLNLKKNVHKEINLENFDLKKNRCHKIKNEFNIIEGKIDNINILKFYNLSFEILAFLRKGVICTICNYDNHKFIIPNTEMDEDKKYIGQLVVSEKFCFNFWKYLSEYFRFKLNIVVPYLLILNNLNNCINEENNIFKYDFEGINYDDFSVCFNDKDEFNPMSTICEKFCQNFNINNFNDLIDGDLQFIDNLLMKIKKLKMFKNNNEIKNIKNLDKDNIIFKTKSNDLYNIDKYHITVKKNGINLFDESDNNGFSLTLNSNNINKYEDLALKINNIKLDDKSKTDSIKVLKARKKIELEEKIPIYKHIYKNNIEELKNKIKLTKYKGVELPSKHFLDNLKTILKEKEEKYFIEQNK